MMAGAYCQFCGHRCFVDRVLPVDAQPAYNSGRRLHMATCLRGADFDRRVTGYDYRTAINPCAPPGVESQGV